MMFLALLLLLPAVYVIARYNTLTSLRNHIRESWADVDTELQRRHDVIPNLVAVVKGYAAHERALFEEVARLRAGCLEARGPRELSAREDELDRATARLLAVAEAYPALKADTHFLALQKELVGTEDRIAASRRFYNGNVRDYRNACETFPSNLVAGLFGFGPSEYFRSDEGRRAPDLKV